MISQYYWTATFIKVPINSLRVLSTTQQMTIFFPVNIKSGK